MRPTSKTLFLLILLLLTISRGNSLADTTSANKGNETDDADVLLSVPFITLRNITGQQEPTNYFGGERGELTAGHCNLRSTSLSSLNAITEKAPFYIPSEILKLTSIVETTPEELLNVVKASAKNTPVTLYTHGFNIDFEKGCKRASMLQRLAGLESRFLYFSWPSDGGIMNYTYDEADIYWSIESLRQTIDNMLSRFGRGNVNLASHSLGTRGVFLAMVMMAQAEQAGPPPINQVVFMAPDIDAATFKQYLPLIKPMAKNITIYTSANDNALALSRQVHGYPRLGESGAHLEGLTGVEIIDLSNTSRRSPSGHIYHLYHNDVAKDLDQILNHAKPANQRDNLNQAGQNYWLFEPATKNE